MQNVTKHYTDFFSFSLIQAIACTSEKEILEIQDHFLQSHAVILHIITNKKDPCFIAALDFLPNQEIKDKVYAIVLGIQLHKEILA